MHFYFILTTGEMESTDNFYGVSRQFFEFEINKKVMSKQNKKVHRQCPLVGTVEFSQGKARLPHLLREIQRYQLFYWWQQSFTVCFPHKRNDELNAGLSSSMRLCLRKQKKHLHF